MNKTHRAHNAHDAAKDREECGGEDRRDTQFLPFRHVQPPNAGNRHNEQDEIGEGADDCRDKQRRVGRHAFSGDPWHPILLLRLTMEDGDHHHGRLKQEVETGCDMADPEYRSSMESAKDVQYLKGD